MAPIKLIKHNPMFLSEEELEYSFVVREAELGLLLRIVRENDGPTNQHVIVIGTRGMGKTMLVRRLSLAIRKDDLLGGRWYPVVLSEEIYDVAGEGELWLRVLERIAMQEREAKRDHLRWLQRYETLRKEMDKKRLKVQALAALGEFAAERQAKLMVVVENLQMLLGEQSDSNDAWDLRQTLLNNPEVMLVATATMRFREIGNVEKANFELFREITLSPLSTDDCRVLWHRITGEELVADRIRPMEILTGGSPRLLAILADFAKGRSLAELMDDLVVLIDDHTTYFKANVEYLPAVERRVFVTLAEIWEPAEARQVAERCRLSVNTASAMLKKLVARGAVAEEGKVGRKNLYQIVERLYNIYHLMRLSGAEADRVRALVRFMVPLYGKERVACALADEACRHEGEGRISWVEGYKAILDEASHEEGGLERLHKATPKAFFELPEAAEVVQKYAVAPPEDKMKDYDSKLWNSATESFEKGDFQQAVDALDLVLELYHGSGSSELRVRVGTAGAIVNKGVVLGRLDRKEEAVAAYDEVIRRFGIDEEPGLRKGVAYALVNKGFVLGGLDRKEEAIAVYDEVIRRFGVDEKPALREQVARALVNKGVTLSELGRYEEAIAVYGEVFRRFENSEEPVLQERVTRALVSKGIALGELGRYEEAIAVYDEVIRRFGVAKDPALRERVAHALVNKGVVLGRLGQKEEEVAVYDEVIRRFENSEELALQERVAGALVNKGVALGGLGREEEEVAVYDEVIMHFGITEESALLQQVARALVNKGVTLGGFGRYEETIAVYDEVIRRFANAEEPALREQFAHAIVNKGVALIGFGRREEAIAVCDEVIRCFGNAEEPALREHVARAFVNKGVVLVELSRWEEAIAVCDEVIRCFGNAEEPALREHVARAIVNKGVALVELCRWGEAIAVCDEVIRRFGNAGESNLMEHVARALVNKGGAFRRLGREEEAIAAYDEVMRRFGHINELVLREGVARALNGKAWIVYERGDISMADRGIADVEKAISILPQYMALRHTLACLLGMASRWEEAFAQAKQFADDDHMVRQCPQDILSFFVDAAAAGQAEMALSVIEGTRSEPAMEPLVVALKISAGKPYRAPREVAEVANDIRRRIEDRARALRQR